MTEHDCCTRGSVHTGTPVGEIIKIAGLDTYVSRNTNANGRAIFFLHDAFGWTFINNRLLADTFAAQANVDVHLPDLLEGDGIPESAISSGNFDWGTWMSRHPKDKALVQVENFAKELVANHNVNKLGAVGYCWGGFGAFHLGGNNLVDVVAVAHPSLFTMDEIAALKKPCLFLCAEIDQQLTPEKAQQAEALLADRKEEYKFVHYPGVSHGFAVRFDAKEQVAKKSAEDAKDQVVAFFGKYLV